MITIIYAHPLEDGMNATIKNALVEHLHKNNHSFHLIDLYNDAFQPAMTAQERQTFFSCKGESNDPLVKQYQTMLKESDHLVFIFPIWFFEHPAILKGFLERTCLPGFAYTYTQNGVAPLLTHIKKLTVLTTSGAPTEIIKNENVIEGLFINRIMHNLVGSGADDNTMWLNFGPASQEGLDDHITKVKNIF